MKANIVKATVVVVSLLVIPVSAFAGPLVTGFEGGSDYKSYYTGDVGDVVGFRFIADSALTITKLGVYLDSDGTLNSTHEVGLWRNSDQVLLGSVVVDSATGELIDGFIYEDLGAPIVLIAGEGYTLGALYSNSDDDHYMSGPSSISLSGISATIGVHPIDVDLGFVYPTEETIGNLARLGPNAFAGAVAVVPVPASFVLAGLGAGLVARFRGRRRGN